MKAVMNALVPSERIERAARGIRAIMTRDGGGGGGARAALRADSWHARVENDVAVSWNPATATVCPLCGVDAAAGGAPSGSALYIATGLPAVEKAALADVVRRLCGFASVWYAERFEEHVPEMRGMIFEQRAVLDGAVMQDSTAPSCRTPTCYGVRPCRR